MNQKVVVADVGSLLIEVENDIDRALARGSKLLEALLCARQQLDLSAVVGRNAYRRVVSTLTALGQARDEVVAAHHGLDAMREEAGLPVVAFGGGTKPDKPPPPPPGGGGVEPTVGLAAGV